MKMMIIMNSLKKKRKRQLSKKAEIKANQERDFKRARYKKIKRKLKMIEKNNILQIIQIKINSIFYIFIY